MNQAPGSGSRRKDSEGRRVHISIRINVFFFATFILFSVLIVRLAYLQFVKGPEFHALQNKTTNRDITIAPIRGNIYDRSMAPIASTISVQSCFFQVTPSDKKDSQVKADQIKLAKSLADVFAKQGDPKVHQPTAEEIIAAMDVGIDLNGNKAKDPSYMFWPRRIKSDLKPKEIAYLAEHRDEYPGIDVSEESTRVYVDPAAVQLVGYLRPHNTVKNFNLGYLSFYKNKEDYLNDEYVGFDGLEFSYQDDLRGKNGSKTYPVNSLDQIIGKVEVTPPEKGHNLVLAMDKNVQRITEQAIRDHLTYLKQSNAAFVRLGNDAVSGYAVAMEVDTGKVMTMASIPDYDPNAWIGGLSQDELSKIQSAYQNGTIRDRAPNLPDSLQAKRPHSVVPLGSTIKPLSVLIGLKEGLFGPYDSYYDKGFFMYGKDNKSKIPNSDGHAYGPLTPATAIEHSSNTFMAEMVGNRLYMNKQNPVDLWDSYMKKFGLGKSTGSGLPGEYAGTIEYNNTKTSSNQANLVLASFGQMGRYTTLQLAQYTAMLGNKGKRLKPQFLKEITTYDGKPITTFDQPEVLNEEKFNEEYWRVLFTGMKSEVDGFEGFPYDFARKTGTSEQDIAGVRHNNAVFIAFAPLDKPKLAVAVVVPDGGFGRYGAAPIARKIFDAYDQYFGLNGVPKGPPQPPAAPAAAPPGGPAQAAPQPGGPTAAQPGGEQAVQPGGSQPPAQP